MTGSRYTDWTAVHVVGDREAAAVHLPQARKLLGFVVEEAARNGLGVANLRRELDDGTVLLAEKFGELPRVTIILDSVQPDIEPSEPEGGFLAWPHWGHSPTDPFGSRGVSVDPENGYPQAWLQFVGGSKVTHYKEAWEVADRIQGARFATYDTPELYPNGMGYTGNVEWKDGEDFAITWYGYYSRYFRDYQDASGRYQFVLNQGQILLYTLYYVEQLQDAPAFLTWPIAAACLRAVDSGRELVVMHVDYAGDRDTEVVAYEVSLNRGSPEKGDWTLGAWRSLGTIARLGEAVGFVDAMVPWFFSADGRRATRIINWTDVPSSGAYYGTSTVRQEVAIGAASISVSSEPVDRLYGDYQVIGTPTMPSGFRLAQQPSLPVMADYRGNELVVANVVWKESTLSGFSPDSVYEGDVDFLAVLELDGQEFPLIERRVNRERSMQDYHLLAFVDLRHSLFAGWRVKGLDGTHTVQAFARLGQRWVYGPEVPAEISAGWLPPSVTDTRETDTTMGGALLFGQWFQNSRYTPSALGVSGVAYGASPRTFAHDMMGVEPVVQKIRSTYAIEDNLSFGSTGSWCYSRGRYCLSMPGPNWSEPLNYLTGGVLNEVLGIVDPSPRFWPINVLPKPL